MKREKEREWGRHRLLIDPALKMIESDNKFREEKNMTRRKRRRGWKLSESMKLPLNKKRQTNLDTISF